MKKAKLLRRNAGYGLDAKGEVQDGLGKNIEDTSTPMTQHRTTVNLMNTIRDSDAELEFPGLGEHMHRFPSRGKG